jgi:glycosyltransferase involved in cell wall biosynthesis
MTQPRLHVVHLLSGDQWAGAEVMAFHLLHHLSKRGPDVAVMALCLNEGQLSAQLRQVGVPVHVLPESSLSFPQIVRQAARLLRGLRVDVLHSHRYKEHYLAALLSAWTGARLVATVHGLPEPARRRRTWYALQTGLTFQVLRSQFDAVTAVSASMQRVLVDVYRLRAERVHVVVNGIAIPDKVVREAGKRPLHVGSVGRLVAVKRYELFLEVAAVVRRLFPDVQFSVLGDGPDREMLLRKARALGIHDCFRVVEPMADPRPYYQSLDVYMNTSESEGLPLSVLEAMASGVPVVAAAVGGIPEVVGHGIHGRLVDSSRAQDYAEPCAELLANRPLRAQLAAQCRERVQAEFSADVMASRYADLYERVTSSAHGVAGTTSGVAATGERL